MDSIHYLYAMKVYMARVVNAGGAVGCNYTQAHGDVQFVYIIHKIKLHIIHLNVERLE